MNLELIIGANVLIVVFTPLYMLLRLRMTKNLAHKDTQPKTSKTLIGFLFTHITMVTIGIIYLCMKLGIVVNFNLSEFGNNLAWVWLFILNIFSLVILAYGGGLYSGAIIHEQYTSKSLTKRPEFPVLKAVELFLHGPISHIMMFNGIVFSMMLTAFLDFLINSSSATSGLWTSAYLWNGVIAGIVLAASSYYSLTWRDQIQFFVLVVFITFVFLTLNGFAPLHNNGMQYFLGFIIVGTAGTILADLYAKSIDKEYPYKDVLKSIKL